MKHFIKLYILVLIAVFTASITVSCGSGGEKEWQFSNRFVENILPYKNSDVWETWWMTAVLVGDDNGDYSFHARLIVTRDGDKIYGYGNANGYSLGTFLLDGTRIGDNIEFKLISQNRYRAFSLTGKGIYQKSDSQIGGNSLKGRDFNTVFDDPVDYTGNFQIQIKELVNPNADSNYEGDLDGAYNSIEDGKIALKINEDGTAFTIESFSGSLVGETQTQGEFNFNDPEVFGNIEILLNKFSAVGSQGLKTVEINGAITDNVASGVVIFQDSGKTYFGAFTALLK